MSQIGTIIQNIANMSVNGITAKYNNTIRSNIESANLPYRFIDHRNAGIEIGESVRVTLGSTTTRTDWVITDIMLYRAVNAGINQGTVSLDVYGYMGEYASSVRAIATSKYAILRVSGKTELLEYPEQSGRAYDSVVMQVFLREIV